MAQTMMVAVVAVASSASADATDFPALSVNAEVAVRGRGLRRNGDCWLVMRDDPWVAKFCLKQLLASNFEDNMVQQP